jgi:hypothetical protein
MSGEDGLADSIRPRLDAVGADVDRVLALQGVLTSGRSGDLPAPVNLAVDLDLLAEALGHYRPRLLVIDPLLSFLGRADTYTDNEVRSILGPLCSIAAHCCVAVVGVIHLNKGGQGGLSALHRLMASVAFPAMARTVFLMTPDPVDRTKSRRLFLCAKSNIGREAPGLAYRIVVGHSPSPAGDEPRLEWLPGTVGITADEALSSATPRTMRERVEEALGDGPLSRTDLIRKVRLPAVDVDRALDELGDGVHCTLDTATGGRYAQRYQLVAL